MAFDLSDEELQATREMNKTAWESEIDKWSREYLIERYKDLVEIEKEHKKENGELREKVENSISTLKIREIIEELNKRIDYLDKELSEAYIQREKLGTETELDANEQYIYNMEQERSIRHIEKYAYLKLLEGDK